MRFILIVLFSLLTACSTLNEPTQSAATLRYDNLVNELKNSIRLEKIVELRGVYSKTDYTARLDSETALVDSIETAIGQGNWRVCITDNNELLAINYTNLFAHYSAMVCLYELQQSEPSHYHQQMLNGLLEAFWQTGNGEQSDTAFYAINENDVRSFIEFHGLELHSMAMARSSQSEDRLVRAQVYDMAKDEEVTWFFRLAVTN